MKILFYGNCQLGALSKHIRCEKKYEILNCNDYGLNKFWLDEGLFAVWTPENLKKQKEIYPRIIKAVKDCDVFIFQHHNNEKLKGLSTKNLIKELKPRSSYVCVPNLTYAGYLYHKSKIDFLIKFLYQNKKIKDPEKIFDLIKNNTFDFTKKEFEKNHDVSISCLNLREKKCKYQYKKNISILDFIKKQFDKKFLFYSWNHPSIHLYNEIIKHLDNDGIRIERQFDSESELPNSIQVFPEDLLYFNNHFTKMENLEIHKNHFISFFSFDFVVDQIEIIKKINKIL